MRRRAFTLAETMVAAALLGVVLLVLTSAVITAYQVIRRAGRQSEVQRNVLLVVRRFQGDLRLSHPESLYAPPRMAPALQGAQYLSMAASNGTIEYSSYGQTLWQRWITCYRDPATDTVRVQDRAITPVWYPKFTPPVISPLATDHVIAREIVTLTCRVYPEGTLMDVHVEARDENFRSAMNTTLRVANSGD